MFTQHYLSFLVNFWGIIDSQCCNYYHLPSDFSSKFQSFMTIFHHKLLTREVRVLANGWRYVKVHCTTFKLVGKYNKSQHTIEGSLFHLYMCWNVVSTWKTSGHGECEHDTWQFLKGKQLFLCRNREPFMVSYDDLTLEVTSIRMHMPLVLQYLCILS
jgi:hypothetical protein